MPKTSTVIEKTQAETQAPAEASQLEAGDLRLMEKQLAELEAERASAVTRLQSQTSAISRGSGGGSLTELNKLSGYIGRLDEQIKEKAAAVTSLVEALKTDDQKAEERRLQQLTAEQTARKAEIAEQLPQLTKAFNLQSAQLAEQWDTIRRLLSEEQRLAIALDVPTECLLGRHTLGWTAAFQQLSTDEHGLFRVDPQKVNVYAR